MRPGYVGPPYRRSEIYAARVSYADDDAHRPPQHDFAAAARAALRTDGRTDGQTDRRTQQRFKTLKACAIRVITDKSFCKKVVHTRSPSVGFRR